MGRTGSGDSLPSDDGTLDTVLWNLSLLLLNPSLTETVKEDSPEPFLGLGEETLPDTIGERSDDSHSLLCCPTGRGCLTF